MTVMKVVNDKKYDITPLAMITVENKIYFSEKYSQGLYCYNLEAKKLDYMGCLCDEFGEQYLFNTVVRWNDKLIFIPFGSIYISMYNLSEGIIDQVKLPDELRGDNDKFFCAYISGDSLYLFGYAIKSIYIFNLKTGIFQRQADIISNMEKLLRTTRQEGFFIRDCVVRENCIYLISLFENAIFVLDTNTDKISRINMNSGDYGFSGMCVMDDKMYLIPYAGSDLTIFDLETNEVEKLTNEIENCIWSYSGGVIWGNRLYMIPCYGGTLIGYDLENKKLFVEGSMQKKVKFGEKLWAAANPVICNAKIVAGFVNEHGLMVLDPEENSIDYIGLASDKIVKIDLSKAIRESYRYELTDFVEALLV